MLTGMGAENNGPKGLPNVTSLLSPLLQNNEIFNGLQFCKKVRVQAGAS